MKKYGVQSTGLIAPIIREGDNLAEIVVDTVLNSGINIEDGDVIGITESVVARAEGNYVTIDEVAENIKKVMGDPEYVVLYHPIHSRNRFAMILKAFARAVKKRVIIYMDLVDEVGNVLRNHPFTGLNYVDYYKSIIESEGKEYIIITEMTGDTPEVTTFPQDNIVDCSLHPFLNWTKYTLMSFCKDKCNYGLLGSNKASEEKLKLFPSKEYSEGLIKDIQSEIMIRINKTVQVMVYGDGCFKDPVGGIWEFADPVVSPAFTGGLKGTPNELKLKNLADEKFKDLNGEELNKAIKEEIKNKDSELKGNMASQGTTPRRYTDLLGSLMDLTSGSGDKGTPIVYIKNYFKNYGDN